MNWIKLLLNRCIFRSRKIVDCNRLAASVRERLDAVADAMRRTGGSRRKDESELFSRPQTFRKIGKKAE